MSVFITLDKRRELRYTLDSLKQLAKLMGARGLNVLKFIASGADKTDAVKHIVWAGLIHEDPDLTPDEVLEMLELYFLSADDPQKARQELAEALNEAFAEARESSRRERKRKGRFR